MILDSDTLKKRLRYQGRQYAAGQAARGGDSREPHMLEQAANRIDRLERELINCKTDYEYLLTITDDKAGLHMWLRMRASVVGALLPDNAPLIGPQGPHRADCYRAGTNTGEK